MDHQTPPLAGVRVLDLSRLIPGPYATLLLAGMGADVTKVEPPGEGDYLRLLPPYGHDGMNAVFTALNRGKRSVMLNLRDADGRAALRRMASRADVLVESFRPGVLERLGVGLGLLRAENERLITCSISGYDRHGPHAGRAGHDLTYQALAGALSLPGATGPGMPALPLADLAGGLFATQGILAALVARAASGRGRHVEIALETSVGALLLLDRAEAGLAEGFAAQLRGGRANYRLYRCADDRYLAVAALEPKFWLALCRALDHVEWENRLDDEDQQGLAAAIESVLAQRPAAEWAALLHAADVPCDVVLGLDEAHAYPSLPGAAPAMLPAPRQGEHTAAVLAEQAG